MAENVCKNEPVLLLREAASDVGPHPLSLGNESESGGPRIARLTGNDGGACGSGLSRSLQAPPPPRPLNGRAPGAFARSCLVCRCAHSDRKKERVSSQIKCSAVLRVTETRGLPQSLSRARQKETGQLRESGTLICFLKALGQKHSIQIPCLKAAGRIC